MPSGSTYTCNNCDSSGHFHGVLVDVNKQHLPEEEVPYVCTKCTDRPCFLQYRDAEAHCNKNHGKESVSHCTIAAIENAGKAESAPKRVVKSKTPPKTAETAPKSEIKRKTQPKSVVVKPASTGI